MDDNGNGQKSGMPKLFEIYRRQRQDSESSMSDCPEIDFSYADSDSYENEIAELYSYSEGPEFQFNIKAFELVCNEAGVLALWQSMSKEKRFSLLTRITDQMELCNKDTRANASRALLYIAQGCWGEVQSDQEQSAWVRRNCFMLLACSAWNACMQLLNMEIECWVNADASNSTNTNSSNNNKQQQVSAPGPGGSSNSCSSSSSLTASSSQLRVLLSILYTMVETLRWPADGDTDAEAAAREAFCAELSLPQEETGELLAVTLLGMVTRFCNSSPPQFPIRKLLLLLWKCLLVTLGGTDTLRALKSEYRIEAGLPPNTEEDTVSVCRGLRPASPPAPATDLLDQQQQHNMVRRRPFRRSLMKQSSLDDSMGDLDLTGDEGGAPGGPDDDPGGQASGDSSDSGIGDGDEMGGDSPPGELGDERRLGDERELDADLLDRPPSPRPPTPSMPHTPPPPPPHNKGLPWTPKVRQKDVDVFLDISREKFVGLQLMGDRTTLAGLPPPIHEGVHTLTKHVYTSLSEVQTHREEEIFRLPMSRPEREVPLTPAELLYQSLLPTLPQCMIALLKVLLAAAPTSKAKTDSINITADVLPQETPLSMVQSMKLGLGLDVHRHKEVVVKAVSASLLLLLKHLKLNHVYQFEFMSQHLVFANCIPLILKFFNQSIMAYVQAKNTIALLDFPACVIGDGADLSSDALLATIGAAAGEGADPKVFEGGSNVLPGDSSPSTASTTSSSLSTTSTTASTSISGNNNNNPSNKNNSGNNFNNNNEPGGGGGGGGCGDGHNSGSNTSVCCWRNMFSCINLLRVLNKLCKWKHSRIMMLVVFKSAPILKRTLMVKHAMLQLYVLKLLKMQTKYLGRQWRKSNMKTLSAIYQMVRHRLTDDWAYGNDPDARPWDFQTEECSLRAAVDRFNARRYHQPHSGDPELQPVDNCITSVLGRHVELAEEFTRCYEVWLQREVLNTTIHWDLLLSTNTATSSMAGGASKRRLCGKCVAAAGRSVDGGNVTGDNKDGGKVIKEGSNSGGGGVKGEGEGVCECQKRLVTEGGNGSSEYTPLIQQLSGHNTDGVASSRSELRRHHREVEEEEEHEFDKKKMQTMIKRNPTNNGGLISGGSGSGGLISGGSGSGGLISSGSSSRGIVVASNGTAIVDIPIDDVCDDEGTAMQTLDEAFGDANDGMDVDATHVK